MSATAQKPEIPQSRAATLDRVARELTLAELAALVLRRRKIVLLVLAGFLALSTLYCVTATRRYEATGQIEIQKEGSTGLGELPGEATAAAEGTADALDFNVTVQTQAKILESDGLALEVIEQQGLEKTGDFFAQKQRGPALPDWTTPWRMPLEPLTVGLEQAPNRRAAALRIFGKHLKVEPVSGTRLIAVSYLDPDPVRAAAVVNALIAAFTEYTFQTRFHATEQASGWLSGQLSDLKQETRELERKAVALQRETGMFGEDESHNVVLGRLESLNAALTTAESNRILKGAIYRAVESGNAELISGLSGNGGVGGTPAMQNSLALIQTLRAQESALRTQLAEGRVRYGEAYPKLAELEAQLADMNRTIDAEAGRIRERARSDAEIAANAEATARRAFEEQKALANRVNEKAVEYALAKEEADESRTLYEGLLGRLKQAGVLQGLRSSNITVVSPARVPATNSPKKPNVPLYYLAAMAAGLIVGAGAAVAVEATDKSIQSLEDAERVVGAPMLAIVPEIRHTRQALLRMPVPGAKLEGERRDQSARYLIAASAPHSAFAEALRSLRTSLLLSRGGMPPQVILVTSALPGEGKSTLSLNLAAVFSQQGAKVLLVDADLRSSMLHARLGVDTKAGLSAALASKSNKVKVHPVGGAPNLSLLPGGAVPPFPAELLGSERMRELVAEWRRNYGFVIVDSPPVLPVTDSILLSQLADATLLVVRHGVTAKQAAQRSYQSLRLRMPREAILGVVLNGVTEGSAESYGYYGYTGEKGRAPGAESAHGQGDRS